MTRNAFVLTAALLTISNVARANTCDELHDRAAQKKHDTPEDMKYVEVLLKSCVSQPDCNGATRTDCQSWLGELLAEIPTVVFDAKEQQANGGELSIVPDAITVDGERVMDAEVLAGHQPLELNPGNHTFVFRHAGARDVTLTRDIRASRESKRIAIPALFRLIPASVFFDVKERQANGGEAVVRPESILIDGVPVKSSEAISGSAPYDVVPGKHTFVFTRGGSAPISIDREVPPSTDRVVIAARFDPKPVPPAPSPQAPTNRAPSESESSSARPLALGGLGLVAAAGLVVGSIFGIKAIANDNDAGCDRQSVCRDPDQRRSAQSAATVSTAGFVVGAVGLAGFVLALVAWPSSSEASKSGAVHISPFAGRDGGGVAMGGRW